MRILTCIAAISIGAVLAGSTSIASARTEAEPPNDVTCSDVTLYAPSSDTALVNVPVLAQTLLQQCQSATGSQLRLLSPAEGFTAEMDVGSTWTQIFVVVNLKGEQGEAKAVVIRK